jgi:ABC-type sugar transport system permease subunit
MKVPLKRHPAGAVPAAVLPARARYHPRALKILLGLAALVLLVNLGFLLLIQRVSGQVLAPRQEQSKQITMAMGIDERRVLAATLANEVLLLEEGRPVHQATFPAVIGGIAVAPGGDIVYVGTADGKMTLLDAQLQPIGSSPIGRRIVGVRSPAQGGVLVANGIGAFSDRYYITYFSQDAKGADAKPTWTKRVEFTITDLQISNGTVFYGTANARVGAIGADGEQLWVTPLRRTASRLLPLAETGRVLVGDEKGSLTLLDNGGNVVWDVAVSQYPIRGLHFDERTAMFFAGDQRGTLYAVDTAGKLRLSHKVAQSDLETLIPVSSGQVIVVPRDGQWFTLNPAAVVGSGLARQLRLGWLVFDILALIPLLVATVLAVEPWRAAMPRLALRFRHSQLSYLFLLPSLILIMLVFYYPAAMAAYYSLTSFSLRRATDFIGFANYRTILTEDFYFRVGFTNMVIILITGIIKSVVPPLLAAELVFWLRKESHRYIFRTLFVLPAVVPGLVATLLWRQVYDPIGGLLNQLLRGIGLPHLQRAWLGDEQTALWAIIGAGFPWIGAFAFLIYLGGLLNINAEMYDSAKIDGAGWWQRFWRIDMPLLAPQHGLILFFSFLGSVQGFGTILIFTRGGPGYSTYVPGLQMFLKIAEGDFGYASAIGMILFAIVMVGTALRFVRRGAEA